MALDRPGPLSDQRHDGVCPVEILGAEAATGRLGAVLRAPRDHGITPLGPHGPWLATDLTHAKRVLGDASGFDFASTVSRDPDLSASAGDSRTGHLIYPPLSADQVARGRATFETQWRDAIAGILSLDGSAEFEAMELLRRPVARATCAAALGLDGSQRDAIADLVLAWLDALAPIISSKRRPHRWSRARRVEHRARTSLEQALAAMALRDDRLGDPASVANLLAAGTQVPIAAGAWLLVFLAAHPEADLEVDHAVWESLRVAPPTWVTARVTTAPLDIADQTVPAGAVALVSPLLLGRLPDLAPESPAPLSDFCPERWRRDDVRPGAWLPFGAGAHACPGRTLGLALLRQLATWALAHDVRLLAAVATDQSRGIMPSPAQIRCSAPTQ